MSKLVTFIFLGIFILISNHGKAQFNTSDIKYWIGSGKDTAILVVSFNDHSWDSSYIWAYLHDGDITGQELLAAVQNADINFTVNMEGGFLNDIQYGDHTGIGGANGFYWSTWSGMNIASMVFNNGISTILANNEWFGCSFTDFNPPVAPAEPISAFDPYYFTSDDCKFWIGSGSDTTLFIIDFHDGLDQSAFAWAYVHQGEISFRQMLSDIDAADDQLSIIINNDSIINVAFGIHSGSSSLEAGWILWSANNLGNWRITEGLNGSFDGNNILGLSFSTMADPQRPDYPIAVTKSAAVFPQLNSANDLEVFPNPASDFIKFSLKKSFEHPESMLVTDIYGKVLVKIRNTEMADRIPVSSLLPGNYILVITGKNYMSYKLFTKQ